MLNVTRRFIKDLKLDPPPNFKLAILFKYSTKNVMANNVHWAAHDIAATLAIFQNKPIFKKRKEFVFEALNNLTIYAYDDKSNKPNSPNNVSSISSHDSEECSTGSLEPSSLETEFN